MSTRSLERLFEPTTSTRSAPRQPSGRRLSATSPRRTIARVAGLAVGEVVAARDTFILATGWDLEEFRTRGRGLPWLHGRLGEPLIGRATSIRAVPGVGLQVEAEIHADGTGGIADRLVHLAEAGLALPCSVGFEVVRERRATKAEVKRYGVHRVIEQARLVELSFVDVGADAHASLRLVPAEDDEAVAWLAAALDADSPARKHDQLVRDLAAYLESGEVDTFTPDDEPLLAAMAAQLERTSR